MTIQQKFPRTRQQKTHTYTPALWCALPFIVFFLRVFVELSLRSSAKREKKLTGPMPWHYFKKLIYVLSLVTFFLKACSLKFCWLKWLVKASLLNFMCGCRIEQDTAYREELLAMKKYFKETRSRETDFSSTLAKFLATENVFEEAKSHISSGNLLAAVEKYVYNSNQHLILQQSIYKRMHVRKKQRPLASLGACRGLHLTTLKPESSMWCKERMQMHCGRHV